MYSGVHSPLALDSSAYSMHSTAEPQRQSTEETVRTALVRGQLGVVFFYMSLCFLHESL